MNEENLTPWTWIANYVKGEISEEEMRELSSWVKASAANKELFDRTINAWNISNQWDISYEPDVERGWQRFKQKIDLADAPEITQADEPEGQAEAKTIYFRPLRPFMRIAAGLLLLIGVVYLATLFLANQEQPMLVQQTEAQKEEIVLPDGSTVVLNRNSRISFAEDFSGDRREVYLTGEAFFDVRKLNGKPFIIYTGNTKTEVLGTSFIVKSDTAGENAEVMVVTGKVAFSLRKSAQEQVVYLNPGEKGVQIGNKIVEKQSIDNPNFLAWKEEKLTFTDTRMDKVVQSLEEYFGVTIQIKSSKLSACRFTGTFKNPSMTEVMEVLSVSVDLTYTADGQQYTLSGEGCQ